MDYDYAEKFFLMLLNNPHAKSSDGFLHQIYYFLGVVKVAKGEVLTATTNFSKAISLRPRVGTYMQSLAVLASAEHCESALELSAHFGKKVLSGSALTEKEREYYINEHEIMIDNIRKSCGLSKDER
ncbi:hypothetical protein GCM10027180_05430 [Microbulbifer echini]